CRVQDPGRARRGYHEELGALAAGAGRDAERGVPVQDERGGVRGAVREDRRDRERARRRWTRAPRRGQREQQPDQRECGADPEPGTRPTHYESYCWAGAEMGSVELTDRYGM